jgi:two-component system phosphate regulon response regulator OmpR
MNQAAAKTDKILVVDDDARIRDLLRRYLTQEGFEVILAEDGKALNRLMLRETADLIVLDLMMPGEDGLSICRRLRAANDRTPIIMLTAKGEDVDRIVGLEVGADDYLGKPFNPRELLARVHAVLRRRPAQEAPGAPSSDNEVVNFGPFAFDLGARTLRKNGDELPLTTGGIRASRCRARSWPNWPVAASSNRSTAAWTCRCLACASWSRWMPRLRVIFRPCGVSATCSCRMERVDP